MLIDSAKAHKVKKIVMISDLLAGTTNGYLSILRNYMFGGVLHYKIKAENYLRQSGMDYAILRPGELIGHKDVRYFKFQY